MDAEVLVKQLPLLNTLLAAAIISYLLFSAQLRLQIWLFSVSLLPVLALQIGTYLFAVTGHTKSGSVLIVLSILLLPVTITPVTRELGRNAALSSKAWLLYYGFELAIMGVVLVQVLTGSVIEWVTGILDQPVIIINKTYKILFFNSLVACGIALYGCEVTLRSASPEQVQSLKSVFIAFVGLTVYFAYLSSQVLFGSYLSQTELLSGGAVVIIAIALFSYSILKYPSWNVEVQITRKFVFGTLSFTALFMYLAISGTVIRALPSIEPQHYRILLPMAVFALATSFLLFYLSPNLRRSLALFASNYFFRNRYDYRDLWMQFSERSSGALELRETLKRVGDFISDAMFDRQVTIWLRTRDSDEFTLEYAHSPVISEPDAKIRWPKVTSSAAEKTNVVSLASTLVGNQAATFAADDLDKLQALGVKRLLPVQKDAEVIAVLGIGEDRTRRQHSVEDERLLTNISKQIAHLIVNQRLSEELLLAREWESFNRFTSFVIHDLKNLATLQSITLENAKNMSNDPEFVSDAFATFSQSTDKMIGLIASLSVQKGQFSLKKMPVSIPEIISSTFEDLKLDQRSDVMLKATFPPPNSPAMVAGDRELLKKVFTNVLLNALQSLPRGRGSLEVTVRDPANGVIQAKIKDDGCGISPEQLKNLFRPFHSTKKNGMGIGLCHTRSIIEVHGGHIQISSQVNKGTTVEIDFPRL